MSVRRACREGAGGYTRAVRVMEGEMGVDGGSQPEGRG